MYRNVHKSDENKTFYQIQMFFFIFEYLQYNSSQTTAKAALKTFRLLKI